HAPGLEAEERGRGDYLFLQRRLAGIAELELGAAGLHVPGLVLDAMELQAERLARLDEDHLADVVLGLGPDELPAPRLLDAPRLDPPATDVRIVRRVHAHAGTETSSGCACTNASASRSCFGVVTVSQKLALRCAA